MSPKGVMTVKLAPMIEVMKVTKTDGRSNVADLAEWSNGKIYDCGFGDVCIEVVTSAGSSVTRLSGGEYIVKTSEKQFLHMTPERVRDLYGELVESVTPSEEALGLLGDASPEDDEFPGTDVPKLQPDAETPGPRAMVTSDVSPTPQPMVRVGDSPRGKAEGTEKSKVVEKESSTRKKASDGR